MRLPSRDWRLCHTWLLKNLCFPRSKSELLHFNLIERLQMGCETQKDPRHFNNGRGARPDSYADPPLQEFFKKVNRSRKSQSSKASQWVCPSNQGTQVLQQTLCQNSHSTFKPATLNPKPSSGVLKLPPQTLSLKLEARFVLNYKLIFHIRWVWFM